MQDGDSHPGARPRGRLQQRARFWIEAGLSAAAAVLALITAVVPDWIERIAGAGPDDGGGEFEWLITGVLACAAIGLALTARREWHRRLAATS
jgi:hypothetical protein